MTTPNTQENELSLRAKITALLWDYQTALRSSDETSTVDWAEKAIKLCNDTKDLKIASLESSLKIAWEALEGLVSAFKILQGWGLHNGETIKQTCFGQDSLDKAQRAIDTLKSQQEER